MSSFQTLPTTRNTRPQAALHSLQKVTTLAAELEEDLRATGKPERAESEKRYLKSELRFFGVTMPEVKRVAKEFRKQHAQIERAQLIALVEALWASDVHELHMAAVELLQLYSGLPQVEDVILIERMLRTSYTWAYVDSLATTVVGGLVERHPGLGKTLDRWSSDDDFWVRRSAMLALLLPLRRGTGDWPRFARFADAMLDERELFIRKAIGWVLREASKRSPQRVFDYLISSRGPGQPPRAAVASGVTLREAVKYLSVAERDQVLALATLGRSAKI